VFVDLRRRTPQTLHASIAREGRLYERLDAWSRRIVSEVKGVSRAAYDVSGKPLATIDWE
jgi:GMP synthase (glutamine-hydrolysing)